MFCMIINAIMVIMGFCTLNIGISGILCEEKGFDCIGYFASGFPIGGEKALRQMRRRIRSPVIKTVFRSFKPQQRAHRFRTVFGWRMG